MEGLEDHMILHSGPPVDYDDMVMLHKRGMVSAMLFEGWAKDEKEARKLALRFMERFIDDDENPEKIDDGYSFYNNAILVKLSDVKETTKEQFKDFLLKTHTINLA